MAQRSSLEDISLPGSVDAIPDSASVTDEQASPEKHPALVLQEVEDRMQIVHCARSLETKHIKLSGRPYMDGAGFWQSMLH